MTTVDDGLGTWDQLGTIAFPTVPTNSWVYFNTTFARETFRVKWETDWVKWKKPSGYRSFVYLRFKFSDTLDITKSYRLYPREERSIIELPIVDEIWEKAPVRRELWLYQFILYRTTFAWADGVIDPEVLPISLTLEGLLPPT
ncbi:hypothetical protein [Roseofilum sp. Belize Diploria]|uniref:hypothetical protein n=1 Tax=Roseofilum sp. Belize Diploria TaxID=2821501 RepID=UPI001B05B183|nr:hypothetical protein [Roseofilum sp. Belize Diploria]MBP0008055.1 hypothetical protein [Roseofilum sp. Belize Diploria]